MASQPLRTPFTSRELTIGRHVATALWIVSGALLLMLLVWSLRPLG